MAYQFIHREWGAQRPISGILFDMDGLVLDTEKLYIRFWMEAAHCLGYPMTREQALGLRSLNRQAAQAHLDACFGPGVPYDTLRSRRIALMDAYIAENGVDTKPGIYELLDHLNARHIPCAITSSSPMDTIRRHLSSRDLLRRFDKLCSGHEVAQGKPAPDIYLHGAASLGLAPETCLALEDSPAGILSACRAGCLPVLIPDLDAPAEKTLENCYAVADSLTDIPALLR